MNPLIIDKNQIKLSFSKYGINVYNEYMYIYIQCVYVYSGYVLCESYRSSYVRQCTIGDARNVPLYSYGGCVSSLGSRG